MPTKRTPLGLRNLPSKDTFWHSYCVTVFPTNSFQLQRNPLTASYSQAFTMTGCQGIAGQKLTNCI